MKSNDDFFNLISRKAMVLAFMFTGSIIALGFSLVIAGLMHHV